MPRRDVVAAKVVAAIDQDIADGGFAHLAEGDFLRVGAICLVGLEARRNHGLAVGGRLDGIIRGDFQPLECFSRRHGCRSELGSLSQSC